jgi:hypothetical protein
MRKRMSIATLALVGTLAVTGGTAAASGGNGGASGSDRAGRCEQAMARIAERQGITVAQLEAKLKQRAIERLDAAVKAKRISEERAKQLRERIDRWKLCAVGKTTTTKTTKTWKAKRFDAYAVGSMLRGAYEYLDLSFATLRQQFRAGKSLGEIAGAQPGKSVSGLKAAMLEKVTEKLDAAVKDGKLSAEQRKALGERYGKLADRLIAKKKPSSS